MAFSCITTTLKTSHVFGCRHSLLTYLFIRERRKIKYHETQKNSNCKNKKIKQYDKTGVAVLNFYL